MLLKMSYLLLSDTQQCQVDCGLFLVLVCCLECQHSLSESRCIQVPKTPCYKRVHKIKQNFFVMPVDPVLSSGLRAAGNSAALHFCGRMEPLSLDAYKSQRAIVWFHADSCSWSLRKEDMLPCSLDRKLPDGREKPENELHMENVSCMARPHSVEQLGCRSKGFRCFLTFRDSSQTTRELFSSFLSAPVRWYLKTGWVAE